MSISEDENITPRTAFIEEWEGITDAMEVREDIQG